eukprot:8834211-Pyramimonas_sp.AAC.1
MSTRRSGLSLDYVSHAARHGRRSMQRPAIGARGPTTRVRGRAGPSISWGASAERLVSRVRLSR